MNEFRSVQRKVIITILSTPELDSAKCLKPFSCIIAPCLIPTLSRIPCDLFAPLSNTLKIHHCVSTYVKYFPCTRSLLHIIIR